MRATQEMLPDCSKGEKEIANILEFGIIDRITWQYFSHRNKGGCYRGKGAKGEGLYFREKKSG